MRGGSDEGSDFGIEEGDVIDVVSVVREFVIVDADCHRWLCDRERESGRGFCLGKKQQ